MKQYQEDEGGDFNIGDAWIPNDSGNRHKVKMMQEVKAGEAEIIPFDHKAAEVERLKNEAREWRNSELLKADIEINKIEDSGGESMGYRKYRMALREWPQSVGFPKKARPKL